MLEVSNSETELGIIQAALRDWEWNVGIQGLNVAGAWFLGENEINR